jgi:uncharacterized protein (DUF1697 family)
MTVHIALLRAVNLGSHKKVSMSDLKALFVDLGFADAKTLLQSGNVVFDSKTTGAKLEKQLEDAARKTLKLDTEFMVRTAKQWDEIIKRNPFPKEAKSDPGHLVLMACKDKPPKDLKITGAKRERVEVAGKDIYIVYPDGIGVSRLKIGGVVGTGRNWNTVLKLAALTKS